MGYHYLEGLSSRYRAAPGEATEDLQDLGAWVLLPAIQEGLRYHTEEVLRLVLLPSSFRGSYGPYEVLRALYQVYYRRPVYGLRRGLQGRGRRRGYSRRRGRPPGGYPYRPPCGPYPGSCAHA